jgi:hypothetical protein
MRRIALNIALVSQAAGLGGAIDCARDSFIVDSRGIDTNAPWPKYQHDLRNTGNSTTPMVEFVCP